MLRFPARTQSPVTLAVIVKSDSNRINFKTKFMKQSDLINLIGLKSTDQKLVDFFEKNNFGKPPKTVNANQGNKFVDLKALNLSFCFEYNIMNDNFQPPICAKNDNYTFVAYLSSVNFLPKAISVKNSDQKTEDFWDISPKPNTFLELIKENLGEPVSESERFFTFVICLNEDKELRVKYNKKDNMLTECWASIKETL